VYVDALVLRDQSSHSDGNLDQRLYVQQDANWDVTALVDGKAGSPTFGQVVERYVYDPYGNASVYTPGWMQRTGGSAYGWLYLHQGGRYDGATGVYDFRNREYSPTLGRWMQVDPLGFGAGDSNLYRYVGNSPTNATDPSGLADKPGKPSLPPKATEEEKQAAIKWIKKYLRVCPANRVAARAVATSGGEGFREGGKPRSGRRRGRRGGGGRRGGRWGR
jgi:RHS repeat-associated protein